MFPARSLITTLSTVLCLLSPALALTVPMSGWAPVGGDAQFWTDASGACLMREERHGQAFPQFDTPEDARAFALKLQNSLKKQVAGVVTQPVDRAGVWGVLAAYDYVEGGVTYRITQLYLSDSGILRTITGSSVSTELSGCVNSMRDYIRYLAN